MIPMLLAQIGLPLLAKAVASGLGRIDHPVAKEAARALDAVEGAVAGGSISGEALAEANRHLERMAELESSEARAALSEVNRSLRAEVASEDAYVRRMRPTFGYILALAWLVCFGALASVIVTEPDKAPPVLAAFAETWWIWTIGLSVLGVYVAGRTVEKGAAGLPFPGMGRKPGR